ncbi:MAG: hypothetical protein R3E48_09145 [Burkholderiaceae bacterium]
MNSADAKMSLWGAMALAIGTMIGASIFSIFGLNWPVVTCLGLPGLRPGPFLLGGVLLEWISEPYRKTIRPARF